MNSECRIKYAWNTLFPELLTSFPTDMHVMLITWHASTLEITIRNPMILHKCTSVVNRYCAMSASVLNKQAGRPYAASGFSAIA